MSYMTWAARFIVVLAAIAALACVKTRDGLKAVPRGTFAPSPLENGQLENLIRVSDRIYSGAEPGSKAAFAELRRLGVMTVVSVDSIEPNVRLAQEFGLNYVHIPIGYDGVDESACRSLTRLVRTREAPFYIHCHHGRHRGPAAAAIACMVDAQIDGEEAVNLLRIAGSSTEYAGLYRDVRAFVPPAEGVALPELVASAETDSLATWMARADRHFDSLRASPNAASALLLLEAFRESSRQLSPQSDADLLQHMSSAERATRRLQVALESSPQTVDREQVDRLIGALKAQCVSCHRKFRASE